MTGWMTDNAFEAERQKARVRWSASSFDVSILMATFFIVLFYSKCTYLLFNFHSYPNRSNQTV